MLFYCSVCSVSRFTICDIYSNRQVKVSYIDMCIHTYEERHVQTHVHMDTHIRTVCMALACSLLSISDESTCRCVIALTTTKPNCHPAWRWIRESWAPGQTLSLWSGRECLITTEWPRWLWMSKRPTTTPSHPASHPDISQKSTNPVFFFSLQRLKKPLRLSS